MQLSAPLPELFYPRPRPVFGRQRAEGKATASKSSSDKSETSTTPRYDENIMSSDLATAKTGDARKKKRPAETINAQYIFVAPVYAASVRG